VSSGRAQRARRANFSTNTTVSSLDARGERSDI